MRNTAREPRKSQQGFSLLMVLIVLATGSVAIPATLNYVSTSAKAAQISETQLHKQYAADAAVQYSLWMLTYNVDGVVDTLNVENPSYATTVTVNGIDVPTTISISLSGEGGEPGPLPPTESGLNVEAVLEVDPGWAPAGTYSDFDYIVHVRNYGTSGVKLKALLQVLPPDFEYIDGSYTGPPGTFTNTWVTDHWELNWDFDTPLPKVQPETSYPIPFAVRGFLPTGVYNDFGTGYIYYSGFSEQEVLVAGSLIGNYAIGLYDITATGGGQTVRANAGFYESGVEVNSYEVE